MVALRPLRSHRTGCLYMPLGISVLKKFLQESSSNTLDSSSYGTTVLAIISRACYTCSDHQLESDSAQYSSLVLDHDRAIAFRLETADYLQSCLTSDQRLQETAQSNTPAISSFRPLGEKVLQVLPSSMKPQVELMVGAAKLISDLSPGQSTAQRTNVLFGHEWC